MSNHAEPIVPTVLYVDTQRHPWQLAQLHRRPVLYHTPTTLRIQLAPKQQETKHQHQVYCIENDVAWERVLKTQAALQQSLDDLAAGLRDLGSYASRLASWKGATTTPNPLCSTVISAPDPDNSDYTSWWTNRLVPRIERMGIRGHTPKMLRDARYSDQSMFAQRDHFACPTDADWARIEALHQAAETKAKNWEQLLRELGTYAEALADGRYARKEPFMQTTPAPSHVRPARSWGETDIDSVLVGRLEGAGYHWELAKQTPDGRWHHVISSRNTALLRNDQVLMRRERLEALLAPAAALATTSTVLVGVAMMDQAEARQVVEQIKSNLDSTRKLLLDLEEREGWRALGYSSWRECAAAEFGQSVAYLYRQLAAAKIEQAIDSPIGENAESHLRPLTRLDTPAQQRQALDRAGELAGDSGRTAKHVEQAVQEIKPKPATCTRCGAERSETRSLTSYQAGLIDAYPGRAVTLCSRCIPELLAAQRAAQRETAAKPNIPDVAPFWQALTTSHPTAHLWTKTDDHSHRAACGVTTVGLPEGSMDGGHCSSCVRATWQQQSAPAAPPPEPATAPTRLTCPTCGEDIMNGIWGDSRECGSCYQARQRAGTLSRPRRPVSADVSSQIRYLADLEAYTTALEQRFPRTIAAALFLASQLAGDDLTALADMLDDAEYEALAAYRRDRAVPTLESEGIV